MINQTDTNTEELSFRELEEDKSIPLLEIKNLRVNYRTKGKPVRAVDDVNLSIFKGDSLGLVGESGCGKSTLGLAILRLLKSNGEIPTGEIILDINGKRVDLTKLPEHQMTQIRGQFISMIFQAAQDALNPLQKIDDHLVDTLKAHFVNKNKIEGKIQQILNDLEIPLSRLEDRPFQFSGGMQQRISIALSLILDPLLVIADEPTTALDVLVQARILNILKELKDRYNLSLIFISHDLGVIAELTNKIAVMYAGQIVEYGPTEVIFNDPAHPYTSGLLKAIPNILVDVRKISSIPGTPPDLRNPPKGCRFHPRCSKARQVCIDEEPKYWYPNPHQAALCHIFNPDYNSSKEINK
ncbi:MAG: ABC transporter ATP-binding protein [Candidatus Thorarchaeota archaeon]